MAENPNAKNPAPERIERHCYQCNWRWFQKVHAARYPRACPRCRSWRWDVSPADAASTSAGGAS